MQICQVAVIIPTNKQMYSGFILQNPKFANLGDLTKIPSDSYMSIH